MNINELTAIARELANTSGPPAGYVECPKKCGRWTMRDYGIEQTPCWTCIGCPSDAMRDWTPPIAPPTKQLTAKDVFGEIPPGSKFTNDTPVEYSSAPAKPVERRKGQRYAVVDGSVAMLASDLHEQRWNVMWDNGYTGEPTDRTVELWIKTKEWTLIADAPADSSGATGCCNQNDAGYACRCLPTKVVAAKAPPAQEAPKAAPVNPRCAWSHISACDGEKLLRHVRQADRAPPMRWCEKHYLESEARPTDATGTPYKGPERINRALARDEMIDGDCWPEAGR